MKEIFQKYPNDQFVETGTYFGQGVESAIAAGFNKISTIELSKVYYGMCRAKFGADYERIKLYYGDSGEILGDVISKINTPITFWLDGHYSGEETADSCPLMKELEHIKSHPINTHTILIDDLRCWTKDQYGFDLDDVKNKLKEINPNYIFSYESKDKFKDDILVAKV